MSSMFCDGCNSLLTEPIYTPLNSKRGAKVFKCSHCSLVQTKYITNESQDLRDKSISTDADWGNVRHGKGIRYTDVKTFLTPILDDFRPSRVLDIGSNRGDFVKDIVKKDFVDSVVAVEPDIRLSHEYTELERNDSVSVLWKRFEDCDLTNTFDFIYSCQTLEHASSAREMLERSYRFLDNDGLMYIEVPSIFILSDERVVEEFFIDKHTFHFDRQALVNLAKSCGFTVIKDFNSDEYNIKLLFSKSTPCHDSLEYKNSELDELFTFYNGRIQANRNLLSTLVETRLRPLAKKQKVAYWGANRIFDALVKYGGLTSEDAYLLVDTHMTGKLDNTSGFPILHPDYIRSYEPQVCVVLARSSEDIISTLAYNMGVRHVLKFSELFDQVAFPA